MQMNDVDGKTDHDDKTSMSACHAGTLNDDRDRGDMIAASEIASRKKGVAAEVNKRICAAI